MDWPGVAVVAIVFFVAGYGLRAMRGSGSDDSLKLNAPIRTGSLAPTVPAEPKATTTGTKADALTPEVREQIEEFIFKDQKIQAIKTYREATKVGLKEAKYAVEEMQRKLMNPGGSA